MNIGLHVTDQGQNNQNHAAEHDIGILSNQWNPRMTKKKDTICLWDFGLLHESEIL